MAFRSVFFALAEVRFSGGMETHANRKIAGKMNYPAASSGVSKGTTMSKVKVKLLFKVFLIRPLVRDVLLDSFRVCVFAHRVRVEAACPKVPAPKEPFYLFVPSKDFTGGDTLDYGHDLAYRHCWYALYEKMLGVKSVEIKESLNAMI